MKKLPTTDLIRELYYVVKTLEKNLPKVLRGSFFRKRAIDDIVRYISQIGVAKANLWQEIYRNYPEAIGKDGQVNDFEITINKE